MEVFRTKNNGKTGWKLDYVDSAGVRRRPQFATRAEAEAARDELTSQQKNSGAIWMAMSADDRNRVVAVHSEVRADGLDLRTVWESFKQMRAANALPTTRITLKQAAELTVAQKRPKCVSRYVRELEWYLNQFVAGREDQPADQITPPHIDLWFAQKHANYKRSGLRSRIGMLSSMFDYCLTRKYIKENPCLPYVRELATRKAPPNLLTVEQIKALLAHCRDRDPNLLSFYVIGLFAGCRPESEIHKLKWGAIDLDQRIITVDTSKTQRRVVELEDAAVEWLKICEPYRGKRRKGDVTPKSDWLAACTLEYVKRRRQDVLGAIGISEWDQDIIRHTAASYLLAKLGDAGKTAFRLGHSKRMLETVYKNLVRPAQCLEFWALRPDNLKLPENVIPMPAAAA